MASTRMSEPEVSVASTGPPATVSRRTSAASEAAANLRNGARRDADARPRSSRAAMRTRSITLISPTPCPASARLASESQSIRSYGRHFGLVTRASPRLDDGAGTRFPAHSRDARVRGANCPMGSIPARHEAKMAHERLDPPSLLLLLGGGCSHHDPMDERRQLRRSRKGPDQAWVSTASYSAQRAQDRTEAHQRHGFAAIYSRRSPSTIRFGNPFVDPIGIMCGSKCASYPRIDRSRWIARNCDGAMTRVHMSGGGGVMLGSTMVRKPSGPVPMPYEE